MSAERLPPGLIVSADDLAIHPDTNAGIASAWRNGIVTSATMLMTTPYLAETVRDVARRDTPPIGIHLALTLGKAIASPRDIPDLVDEAGNFTGSAHQLLVRSYANARGQRLLGQIRREFAAQLGLARDHGLAPTHADSHQHVHMNPAIFALVEELLPRFGITRMRLSREALTARAFAGVLRQGKPINYVKLALLRWLSRGVRPRLATPDGFFGVLFSGIVDKPALAAAITGLAPGRSLELCVHPALPRAEAGATYPRGYENDFIGSPARRLEHDVLIDPELAELVRRRGLALRSFDGREKAR